MTEVKLAWTDIENAPTYGGIYAWYARLKISKADVAQVVQNVSSAKTRSFADAQRVAEEALHRFVFSPFRETDFQVQLSGPLKPKFGGRISHEPNRSESLAKRIVDSPEKFQALATMLVNASPLFTAPLYIGMAGNLRTRLSQHKQKILQLREHGPAQTEGSDDKIISGFAQQVVLRQFEPPNLFVVAARIDIESTEHNDIENVLNRINYPIFGRN